MQSRDLAILIISVLLANGGRFMTGVGVDACTVFIVGKDASADGSVMVSHSNDGEFETDPRLVKIPSMSSSSDRPIFFTPENYPRYVGTARGPIPEYQAKGNQTDFVPIGYIPTKTIETTLAKYSSSKNTTTKTRALKTTTTNTTNTRTYSYLEETYGALNEVGLGIGESTCSGIFGATPLPEGTALWSIDELTRLAMERASTARQAVQLMGDMAVFHGGFYGAGKFEGTAESLAVSDRTEAWIFHILPDPTGTSAIWAAQRVPDDAFAILANMFVIRHIDPNDTENFLMSDSVHQVAQDYGWWSPSDDKHADGENENLLDFTAIYSDGEYAHQYYSGRRMWGGYFLAAPSKNYPPDYIDLQSDPVYPVHTIPDSPISLQDLFRFHRYTYQGTPYDLSAPGNLAGGPFGTPDRWKAGTGEKIVSGNWERAIGLYRTSDTYIVQSKQEVGLPDVLWFGPASPLATVFTPFVVTISEIPNTFQSGHQAIFERTSAFWAACTLANIANLKWSYMINDIQSLQRQYEDQSIALMEDLSYATKATVENAILQNTNDIVKALWSLQDDLLFKYASGFVNTVDDMSQMVGYPVWWLQAVGYSHGPPPPPTQPKCCHPHGNFDSRNIHSIQA